MCSFVPAELRGLSSLAARIPPGGPGLPPPLPVLLFLFWRSRNRFIISARGRFLFGTSDHLGGVMPTCPGAASFRRRLSSEAELLAEGPSIRARSLCGGPSSSAERRFDADRASKSFESSDSLDLDPGSLAGSFSLLHRTKKFIKNIHNKLRTLHNKLRTLHNQTSAALPTED